MKSLPLGTKVRLVNIPDAEDADLIGRVGTLCRKHTFGSQPLDLCFGEIGVRLETRNDNWQKVNVLHGEYEEAT